MEFLVNITMTVTGTGLLIILVKKLFAKAMTRRQQLAIWLVLLLQICILPIGNVTGGTDIIPKSNLSIQNYIPTLEEIGMENINVRNLETGLGNPEGNEVSLGKFQLAFLMDAIILIWIIGIFIMAATLLWGYIKFSKKCNQLEDISDVEVLTLFESCKSRLGIKKQIFLKTGAESPIIIGLRRPTICISDKYTKEELTYVFTHELCHFKHRDIYINLCVSAVLCIFWYNPVIWLCFQIIRKDIEMCCDEMSIEATGGKQEYAKVLLKTARGEERFVLASTSFINGEKEVSQRIKEISKNKKKGIFAAIVVVLLIIGVVAVSLTGRVQEADLKVFAQWDITEKSPYYEVFKNSKKANVLILGVDDEMTDTIMLASIDGEANKVDIINIPRDLYFPRAGYESVADNKINAAYRGDPLNTAYAVSQILQGMPIHYYTVLDYEGVKKIVEAIGGVPMNIPFDMKFIDPYDTPVLKIDIPKGAQVFNGDKAVEFLRFRAGYKEGDLGRIKAHQQFIKSAYNQGLNSDLSQVTKTIYNNVDSNLKLKDAKLFGALAAGMSVENINMHLLPYDLQNEHPWSMYPADSGIEKLVRGIYGMEAAPVKGKDVTTSKGIDVDKTTPAGWVTTKPLEDINDPDWITTTPLEGIEDPSWILEN